MSKYSIEIETADHANADDRVVSAFGSLKLITAAAKEGLAAIKGQSGEFAAAIVEQNDDHEREVVRVKATEDIVTLVVNKRLKDEKAQNADATPTAAAQTGFDQSDIAGEEAAAAR